MHSKVLVLLVSLAFLQPHVGEILGTGSEMLERESATVEIQLLTLRSAALYKDGTTNVLFIFQSHCYSFSGERLKVYLKNIYFGKETPGQL